MTYSVYFKAIANQEIVIRQHFIENGTLYEVIHFNLVRNATESKRTYATLKQAKQRVYSIVGQIRKEQQNAL